ncbi:MAG: ATP-binding protein, partial [Myxococcota bacterium]
DSVSVLVRDSGPGVPSCDADRIFDPFFTTKESGQGTGLGLATSRKLAEEVGGSLDLIATGEEGSSFKLRLARV